MDRFLLLTVYTTLAVLASLFGGMVPSWLRLNHLRMQLMMSLVSGLMLGVALFHLLPHGIVESGSLDQVCGATAVGMLAMFFLIRAFHVHHHGQELQEGHTACEHEHHGHGHHGHGQPADGARHAVKLSWMGLAVGLGVHTLFDGVALAASVASHSGHDHGGGVQGIETALAVLLHKPLDAMAITAVMASEGWSRNWRHGVNLLFAAACPLGAFVFFFGAQGQGQLIGLALGFSAGVFLCIGLADLLPEIQFHQHDRGKLSAALLLGFALAWLIGYFEPDHAHQLPGEGAQHHEHPHDHQHGDHQHGDHEHSDREDSAHQHEHDL